MPYEKKYYLKTQQYRNEGIRSFRYLQYTFNATSFVEQFSNKKFFFSKSFTLVYNLIFAWQLFHVITRPEVSALKIILVAHGNLNDQR